MSGRCAVDAGSSSLRVLKQEFGRRFEGLSLWMDADIQGAGEILGSYFGGEILFGLGRHGKGRGLFS